MSDWQEPTFAWQEALDAATEDGDERPTWAYDWPAGKRLAADLPHLRDVSGLRVLDLGCGRGHLGRTALALGAEKVVFADLSPEVLRYLDAWIDCNHLAHRAITWRYRWGDPSSEQFDLILGGDICYRPECHADLACSLQLLLRSDAVAFVSDPRTTIEPGLFAHCADRGLEIDAKRRPGPYTLLQVQHVHTIKERL